MLLGDREADDVSSMLTMSSGEKGGGNVFDGVCGKTAVIIKPSDSSIFVRRRRRFLSLSFSFTPAMAALSPNQHSSCGDDCSGDCGDDGDAGWRGRFDWRRVSEL